jgi:hypothetical protein
MQVGVADTWGFLMTRSEPAWPLGEACGSARGIMLVGKVEQDQVFVAQWCDAQMTDELVSTVSEGAPVV